MHQTSFKNVYNIFKTDASLMPELLEKYSQASVRFRDEEFTQQSELFITKIAQDKKIPKEFRAKFPLYQILIAITKIFMLNEYEIVVFACMLDHCNWKIDEIVYPDEANLLTDFPSNFGIEINSEGKRFIMYLLIITFSLKQYLNEKSEVDMIQAYCEKICQNFQSLFNRWTRISAINKFNYSAPEINRKFKYLSQRDYTDQFNTTKDYNMIVDSIMTLTGSYNAKPKTETTTKPMTPPLQAQGTPDLQQQKSAIFHDLPTGPYDQKVFYQDSLPMNRQLSKGMSVGGYFDEGPGLVRIPSVLNRQPSFSNMFNNLPMIKRQGSFEFFDDANRKKVKTDEINNQLTKGTEFNPNNKNENEELYLPFPMLSKKSSNISNPELDAPPLSRFNSNLSFMYDK